MYQICTFFYTAKTISNDEESLHLPISFQKMSQMQIKKRENLLLCFRNILFSGKMIPFYNDAPLSEHVLRQQGTWVVM